MPSFPWSKKGSHPSVPAHPEAYNRHTTSRASGPPPPPQGQYNPTTPDDKRRPLPSIPSQAPRLPDPRLQGGAPYHLQTASTPPHSDKSSPSSAGPRSPALDVRTENVEPRRTFKERLGFGSSRENLLDISNEDNTSSGRTTGLRRKLSSRRKDVRSPPPQFTSPTDPVPGNPHGVPRRATVANRQGTSTTEADEIRELSSFLRTTAPSRDQQRPFSYVGHPSAGQSQWGSGSTDAGNLPVPRRARTSSLDDTHPRADDRAYGIVYPADDENDAREQEPAYQTSSPVSQGAVSAQETSPTAISNSGRSFLDTTTTPVQRQAPAGVQYPTAQQPSREHLTRKSSLQPSPYSVEQDPYDSVRRPGDPASQQEASQQQEHRPVPLNLMSGNLRPPSRRDSQSEPGTPGNPNITSQQQMQQQIGVARDSGMGGRNRTPEPSGVAGEIDPNQIPQYRELREKYSKVKRYYFEKEDQVRVLQNALAHQRLSSSRTLLDDSGYISRLTRLDGLISQLAYGFRKDWATVPQWLQPYVNKDAVQTGKQECTALGRAFVSEWLCREVFESYFHPSLSLEVSRELKTIQRNIRLLSPPLHTAEEDDALTLKITNWRLATVDGLASTINGPDAQARTSMLVELLNRQLVAALLEHLTSPPPPGVEGGVHMVVELAVGLLLHLPGESRDVDLRYHMPGSRVDSDAMRIETGIPPLGQAMAELPPPQRSSSPLGGIGGPDTGDQSGSSSDEGGDDNASESIDNNGAGDKSSLSVGKDDGPMQGHVKKGLFGGLVGGGKSSRHSPPVGAGSGSGVAGVKHGASNSSQLSLPQGQSVTGQGMPASRKEEERVRLCVFLGAQVRGKGVLLKAPVYRL